MSRRLPISSLLFDPDSLAHRADSLVKATTIGARDYQTIKPRAELIQLYDRMFTAYSDLYPASKAVMHTLADLQLQQK